MSEQELGRVAILLRDPNESGISSAFIRERWRMWQEDVALPPGAQADRKARGHSLRRAAMVVFNLTPKVKRSPFVPVLVDLELLDPDFRVMAQAMLERCAEVDVYRCRSTEWRRRGTDASTSVAEEHSEILKCLLQHHAHMLPGRLIPACTAIDPCDGSWVCLCVHAESRHMHPCVPAHRCMRETTCHAHQASPGYAHTQV